MTDEILIVSLEGELDHHTSTAVREEIDKTIEVFRSQHLVLDFSKISFMDSSGIGVIMGRYNKIFKSGGTLMITGCDDYIHRILDMAGIFTIAKETANVAEAINWIKTELAEEVSGSDG